jgi:branched-chain amino acid transport system ATP-binding protein
MSSFLEVESITAGYGGVTVLRDVSLECDESRVTVLLGSNGAGKTTTLRSISGTVRPRSGAIRMDGRPLKSGNPARTAKQGLGHVPEHRALFTQLTARENLRIASTDHGSLRWMLDLLPELGPLMDRKAGLLSGGEQQMLAVGRALVRRPRTLMVDELSLGLAPQIVRRLLEVLRVLAEREGVCVLLVEQQVHLALEYAEMAYVIRDGQVRARGTPQAIREQMQDLQDTYLGGPGAAS